MNEKMDNSKTMLKDAGFAYYFILWTLRLINLSLVFLIAALLLSVACIFLFSADINAVSTVAYVGETSITRDSFLKDWRNKCSLFSGTEDKANALRMKMGIIDELIEKELLKSEADQRGISLSDELESAVTEDFNAVDFQIESNVSLPASEGIPEHENNRSGIYELLILFEVISSVVPDDIPVLEKEIKEYYERHEALFRSEETVKVKRIGLRTLDQAEEIRRLLKKGRRFDKLASEYSLFEEERRVGGDMGYVARAELPSEIADEIFALKEKQTTPILKIPEGYAVFLLEKRRPGHLVSLEDAKSEIKKRILADKRNEFFKQWLDEKKRESIIKIDLAFLHLGEQ